MHRILYVILLSLNFQCIAVMEWKFVFNVRMLWSMEFLSPLIVLLPSHPLLLCMLTWNHACAWEHLYLCSYVLYQYLIVLFSFQYFGILFRGERCSVIAIYFLDLYWCSCNYRHGIAICNSCCSPKCTTGICWSFPSHWVLSCDIISFPWHDFCYLVLQVGNAFIEQYYPILHRWTESAYIFY